MFLLCATAGVSQQATWKRKKLTTIVNSATTTTPNLTVTTPTHAATTAIIADSSECEYSGFALHTIFNLPVVRYNINSFNGRTDPPGTLEYFNSIGAGFCFSFGRIRVKSKNDSSITQVFGDDRIVTMKNIVGLSFGALFSKSDSIGGSRVMFAPTINVQLLDFQLGFGYELGSVRNNAHRCFLTVSYGIPLTKLTGAGSLLLSVPRRNDKKRLMRRSFF